MGVFDEIRCKYPLPFAVPDWVDWYQSKGLDCVLSQFEITEDGHLVELGEHAGDWSDFHCDLRIYTSNFAAHKDGEWFTETGKDFERIEIEFRFTDGVVSRVKLLKHEKHPAKPISVYHALQE